MEGWQGCGSAGRTVKCAWQRSGFWIEGLDQQPARRLTAVDVLGRGPAAALAGDRHHPAAQPGGPDMAPGPRSGGRAGAAGSGAGIAGEIHGFLYNNFSNSHYLLLLVCCSDSSAIMR
jgi:hypothetical protein